MDLNAVAEIRIHPAIGIARVGNSEKYFLGPETPGETPPPIGGYKDRAGRVKKQAARFRLFAFDQLGMLLDEVTAEDAEITWTVELANTKAASEKFVPTSIVDRNYKVEGPARELLKIQPRPGSVTGPGQADSLDDGFIQFPGKPAVNVPLGQIRTDDAGRLLVLGGRGHSATPTGSKVEDFADNDGWFDDCADGPVRATVRLRGTSVELAAVPAWVVVAPPKFAPAIQHAVTLWDRLFELAVKWEWEWAQVPEKPSLRDEVYPILRRAGRMRWVNEEAFTPHDWADEHKLDDTAREHIFGYLRNPDGGGGKMPKLYSESEKVDLSLTRPQYQMMKAWKEGKFVDDLILPPPAPTPLALDRAVLDACVGAALYPGIEVGLFLLQKPGIYLLDHGPGFRLDPDNVKAGDVTARMAVPWQADFNACEDNWWPAHRPNQVLLTGGEKHEPWARGIGNHGDMVKLWHTLGFVVREGAGYYEQGGPPLSGAEINPSLPPVADGLATAAEPVL